MNALTPLAVQNLDLLRLLADGEVKTKAAAAAFLGRDPGNFNKTVKMLEAEGVIAWPSLTEAGQRIVTAADVAAGAANPVRADAPTERVWTHADFTPNPDQPRKDFDPVQLDELATSILEGGQLQNILARPNPYDGAPLQIVGGERRWRAMGLLIERGQWAADMPVGVEVRDLTDTQVDSLALVENMQRANLKPTEEARAFQRLRRVHGWSNAQIAEKIGKDPRVVQLRLNLLELNGGLTEDEQHQLDSDQITITKALEILRTRPKPLELNDHQRLILTELFQAAARESPIGKAHYWDRVECDGAPALAAIDAYELGELLQVTGPSEMTGRFTLSLKNPAWDLWPRIIKACPEIEDAETRKAFLLSLRARLFGADEAEARDSDGKMSIVWLNGPFALTDEGQALFDAHQESLAQAQKDNERREQERDAHQRAYRERIALARANADAVTERLRATPAFAAAKPDEAVNAAMDHAGHPLPWTYRYEVGSYGCGDIVDAKGKTVNLDYGDGAVLDILKRLVMASVNAAGGLTPVIEAVAEEPAAADIEAPTTDPQADDFDGEREATGEAEFRTWIMARLQRMHGLTVTRAEELADLACVRLREAGEVYGDDSRPWTLQCAVEIADDYAEDFPDQISAQSDDDGHGFAEDGDEGEEG